MLLWDFLCHYILRMGSFCVNDSVYNTEYNVMEVDTVTMPDGVMWKGTEDHSKWVS